MNPKIHPAIVALFMGLLSAIPANAHRTSGLLQASLVEVLPAQIGVEVTLFPGIDIASTVFALLDTNNDGVLSEIEKTVWSEGFMSKQTVTVNGQSLPLTLQRLRTSPLTEMADGHGEIVVYFTADLGPLGPSSRTVVCANNYAPVSCTYQSNGLVPKAPGVRITGHRRDQHQRELALDVAFSKPAADTTRTLKPATVTAQYWFAAVVSCLASLSVAALAIAAVFRRRRTVLKGT